MLRIGCVPYLNSRPLLYGLEQRRKDVHLILRPPSVLTRLLRERKVDVALIPVFELFQGRSYKLVSGLGIASAGNTDSVRLYHKVPVPRLRRVALDRNSRTSNALTQIILKKKYRLDVSYGMVDPSRRDLSELPRFDAAVVIGDAAFRRAPFPFLDLGTEWVEFTRTPFVYALWAARPDLPDPERAGAILNEAKEKGEKHIRAIAAREAGRLGLSRQFCLHYLTHCIYYECGRKEWVGLRTFCRYAAELGLCRKGNKFDFS